MVRERKTITGINFPLIIVLLLVWVGIGILIYNLDVICNILKIHPINKLRLGVHNDVSITIPEPDIFLFFTIFAVTCAGLVLLNSNYSSSATLAKIRHVCTVLAVVLPLSIGFCMISSKIFAVITSELNNPTFEAFDSLGNFFTIITYLILAVITGILDLVLFRILHLHVIITYLYYPIVSLLAFNGVLLIPEIFIVGSTTAPSKLYSGFIYGLGFILNLFYPVHPRNDSDGQVPPENKTKETHTSTTSQQNATSSLFIGGQMSKDTKNTQQQNIPETTTTTSLSLTRSSESSNAMTTVQKLNEYLHKYISNSGIGILGRFFNSARMKYAVGKEIKQSEQQSDFYEAQTKKINAAAGLFDATMKMENKQHEYKRNKQQQEILNNKSEEDLELSEALHNDSELRQQKINNAKMKIENEMLKTEHENIKLKNEMRELKNPNGSWKPPESYKTDWQEAQDEAKVAIRMELEKHILQKLRQESDLQQVRKEGRKYILDQKSKPSDEQDYLLDLLDELIEQHKERKKSKDKIKDLGIH